VIIFGGIPLKDAANQGKEVFMRLRRKQILALLLSLLIAIFLASEALAYQTGYEFQIYGNTNVPTVSLENLSTLADITEFTMTIGNTAYNFDSASNVVVGSVDSYALVTPDTNSSGGVRSNFVNYTFSGFDPGEVFKFDTDVDRDNSNTSENYTKVLFNNGAAPNSQLTVVFSDGSTLIGTLPDYSGGAPYVYSQVVPLPPAVLLLGSSLLGLMGIRRLRKV
jgi:hypothetical protein